MLIVIDIPEHSYKATCNGCMTPPDVENVVQGIKNGTPLNSSENQNKWKSIYEQMYQEKMRELNERKKELEIQLNISVQNIIENEMIMCCGEVKNEDSD